MPALLATPRRPRPARIRAVQDDADQRILSDSRNRNLTGAFMIEGLAACTATCVAESAFVGLRQGRRVVAESVTA